MRSVCCLGGGAQATALATIGKFVLKKKVGEKEAIFGSVTAQEVVEAIRMQVGGGGQRAAGVGRHLCWLNTSWRFHWRWWL